MAKRSDYLVLIVFTLVALAACTYAWAFGLIPEIRGLFNTKPEWLLQSSWFIPMFLVHIFLGGIAILAGSSQFFTHKANRFLAIHRLLGKIYFYSTVPSGIAGFIIGFFATGNWLSKSGFISLAIGWVACTLIGFLKIKSKEITSHRYWMIRSYAFCLAFVTFRLYLGLGSISGLPFFDYYSYLSFLSWIPNILFAEYMIYRIKKR